MSKLLIDINPYLKDPVIREKLILRSVQTSGNVEGIVVHIENVSIPHIFRRGNKKIYLTSK